MEFFRKRPVFRQLENAAAMRRQPMIAADFLHRRDRKPTGFRHGLSGPMGRFMRRRFQRQRNHLLKAIRRSWCGAGRPGFVAKKPVHAFVKRTLVPAPDARLRLARCSHDSTRAKPISSQENDAAPPDVLLSSVPVIDNGLKPKTIRS
jgi:hypothetical protein